MATKTKAPKKASKAKAAKPAGKAAAAKAPKAAKKAGKGKQPKAKAAVVYEETQGDAAAVEFDESPAKPGFFERLRQRRAEKALAREADRQRREEERLRAEEQARRLEEEQRRAREAEEEAERERAAADERKAKAAAAREEKRRGKEAEEARKAQEAIAAAAAEADQARAEQEAKARRAAEREAKRRELEAEERRKAEEQARRDAEEEAEREAEARRLAEQARLRKEAEAKAAAELEPEMEFSEAPEPVARGREMVPSTDAADDESDADSDSDSDSDSSDSKPSASSASGGSAADAQADLMAAELARRRSKPVVFEEELPEPPRIPKAPLKPGEQWREVAAPARQETVFEEVPAAQPTESFGFTLPEAFLLLANDGQWDERAERNKQGAYGGALAGAMLLELLMARAVQAQRDRFTPTGTIPDDPALAAILDRLRRIREKKGDLAALQQMGELAKANRDLLRPFKDSLAARGLAEHGERRHLGLFHRSWLNVTDPDAQEKLQNRLRRAIAGGGTPEPHSILLLGLLDATGQFGTVVPDEAADYNRKRLNGLLGGRDIMGYKVHPDLKALQEIAVRTVLANVRLMTVRG